MQRRDSSKRKSLTAKIPPVLVSAKTLGIPLILYQDHVTFPRQAPILNPGTAALHAIKCMGKSVLVSRMFC